VRLAPLPPQRHSTPSLAPLGSQAPRPHFPTSRTPTMPPHHSKGWRYCSPLHAPLRAPCSPPPSSRPLPTPCPHGLPTTQELELHVTRPSVLPPASLLTAHAAVLARCLEAGVLRGLTALRLTCAWDGLAPEVGWRALGLAHGAARMLPACCAASVPAHCIPRSHCTAEPSYCGATGLTACILPAYCGAARILPACCAASLPCG